MSSFGDAPPTQPPSADDTFHSLNDPLGFPLAFKNWIVQYVKQELTAKEIIGYVAPTSGIAAPALLAAWPPVSPVADALYVLTLPATYDPVGGKTIRWLLQYDSVNAVFAFMGGPPIVVHAASTTLVPRPGDYLITAKADSTGGGGSTTGANQTGTLTVAGVTKDTVQTANVPSSSGSVFSYGGAGSSWLAGGLIAECLGVAAGATVAIANPTGDPRITILPVRIT